MAEQGHFADRLLAAIRKKGSPVCVGLDPNISLMPEEFQNARDIKGKLKNIEKFCRGVLETVAPVVPAVKPQMAYFEYFGAAGFDLYFQLSAYAQELGLIVIGDAKRGDIGSTASAYAGIHLGRPDSPDALTVNGYFGDDGTRPFIDTARANGRGVFVLVRTSNPGGTKIQNFSSADSTMFYEHMAAQVAAWGAESIGQCGYSCVGAVVGATCPSEAVQLRKIMPQQIFLVPGYGAQGATAKDCAACFKADGTGAIVNASRSVLYAPPVDGNWKKGIAVAAKQFAQDIANALFN